MIDDKNRRIKLLEVALYQLTAHGKDFLETHVSKRERLKMLIANAERALRGDDDAGCRGSSTRK